MIVLLEDLGNNIGTYSKFWFFSSFDYKILRIFEKLLLKNAIRNNYRGVTVPKLGKENLCGREV